MALLNVDASLPSQLWAVVRYLAFAKKPVQYEQAKALLNPPCLDDDGKAFEWAVSDLKMLGMVTRAPVCWRRTSMPPSATTPAKSARATCPAHWHGSCPSTL